MSFEMAETSPRKNNPNSIISAYLSKRIPLYRELTTLKEQGWRNSSAGEYFQSRQGTADSPSEQTKTAFYKMTCGIGESLHVATGVLTLPGSRNGSIAVLDLGMAPGGFTAAALAHNANAKVRGISLPMSMGGYEVRVPRWKTDPRVDIEFLDITMLATEMGVDIDSEVPTTHPDAGKFIAHRPFYGENFDVVFCGGSVLRTHEEHRPEYRNHCETLRLWTSQLVLSLGRVRPGGSIVLLMHRADDWHTVYLMHIFNCFAELKLFKPKKAHSKRSSFYMVAQNVQPQSDKAIQAVGRWKRQWRYATLLGTTDSDQEKGLKAITTDQIDSILSEFGEKLVVLSKPIFKIQAYALRTANWNNAG